MGTRTTEDIHRIGYEIAQAMAPGWERHRAFIERTVAPVRAWVLRELAPRPGQTLLELAAGAGDTGYEAAAAVGPTGRLISTDFSPEMVEVARRRAAELGIGNVEHRLIDAERIALDDDSVDGVLCRFGYMLMADRAAALAETRRVLRPGGRVALAVFAAPERNPFFAAPFGHLVEGGHLPPPDPEGPGSFSMASEQRTRGLLEGARFDAVRVEEVPLRFDFADIEECVALLADTAGPLVPALRGLSASERQALGARLEAAFAPFASSEGYRVPGAALCAVAS
jgi:SAM-dependent methyltransferase